MSCDALAGNIQYQIFEPVQSPDGYWYQRVRQINRDGTVYSETNIKSFSRDSKDGLFNPERAMLSDLYLLSKHRPQYMTGLSDFNPLTVRRDKFEEEHLQIIARTPGGGHVQLSRH